MYYSNLSGFHGMLSLAERSRDEPKTDPLTPGGGVLLGILGGGVSLCSPNPDPSQNKKCSFPHPFLDQTSKIPICF